MYRVLYRKWRPAAFSDVVGQPHITDTLRREVENGRLAHAYLFTGSRGTGKTTCAKILAKAVNCLRPQNGDPCNECEVCRGIDGGSILDVVEIDAASNNGVDNIRDLREEANFTPAVGKYRVFIIDEVHMLSAGAFNALLKTLEEPPAHVLFILATTEVHKLPATILSRCQRFDFMRIPADAIAQRLLYIAGQEDFTLTEDAARLIGRLADGGLRDALSLLDQCAGVAGESNEVTADTVNRVAGLAGRDHLFELSRAIREKDSAAALECIDRLHNNSLDMERLCEELISHFRNIMLVKTVKSPEDLVTCSDQELGRLREEAVGFPLEGVLSTLRAMQDTLEKLRSGASRRVEMELLFIRLTNPALDRSSDALLRRVGDLEAAVRSLSGGMTSGRPAQVAPVTPNETASVPDSPPGKQAGRTAAPVSDVRSPRAETSEARQPFLAKPSTPDDPVRQMRQAEEAAERYRIQTLEEPPEDYDLPEPDAPPASPAPSQPEESSVPASVQAPEPSADAANPPGDILFSDWPDVIAALMKKNPLMASVLKGSTAYLRGDVLLIDSRNAQFLDLIREGTKNRRDIREAAMTVTGRQYRLGPYKKDEPAAQADPFAAFVSRLSNTDAKVIKTE